MTNTQDEELEVLESIYGDNWQKEVDERSYSCTISKNIKLFVTLSPLYPSEAPPTYQLLAPCLDKATKQRIIGAFEEIYLDNVGEPVLFQWIERLKEIVSEDEGSSIHLEETSQGSNELFLDSSGDGVEVALHEKMEGEFDIQHGPIIQDRKSIFQGHACRVETEDDVRQVMAILLGNKKIAQATHNVLAYRIEKQGGIVLQDCEDDGESHAGSKVLHLLDILNVKNVLVVVSRWYGGIHLGPDRFRHINNAARQVLTHAGFISSNK